MQRLMIIAHNALQGYAGVKSTSMNLNREFSIHGMDRLVRDFVAQRLLCPHVKGKEIIQRPFGPTLKSSKRIEILCSDFLHIGVGFGESKYLLVLKDMATHYCEVVPCS
jgi:hypothetical protein